MMRILVAPDKFKGSLSAAAVAESIAAGFRDVLPQAEITLLPVADGGEGTAEVIQSARGGEWVRCHAHDALGRAIQARYCRISQAATIVMEMSEAAGVWGLAAEEKDPRLASTFGIGEMLLHAASREAVEHIIVGLGGSATNDGGFGMARALGYRFLERDGTAPGSSVFDLARLEHVERPENLQLPKITAAADVRVPLLGPNGATAIFGPQKGVSRDDVRQFEAALARFADVVAQDLECDLRHQTGAGAAGGLGFGLMSFCGAEMRSGFDVVAEMIELHAAVEAADVVITGEGQLDAQTCEGKAPAGVSGMARAAGKPVFGIVGCIDESCAASELFDEIFVLAQPPITPSESMQRTAELLRDRARELARALH